jgi:hypothetical protein
MKYFILLSFILTISTLSSIQAQDNDLIELSGIIQDVQTQEPVSFTHIIILNKKKGYVADEKGMFSFIVQRNDTILFSSMGYKRLRIFIPDTITQVHQNVAITLTPDTIALKPVYIFPWKNYDEFREAFKKVKIMKPKEEQNFEINIEMIRLQIYSQLYDVALPSTSFRTTMDNIHQQEMRRVTSPTNNLLNPFSWARFFRELEDGKIFRSEEEYSNPKK